MSTQRDAKTVPSGRRHGFGKTRGSRAFPREEPGSSTNETSAPADHREDATRRPPDDERQPKAETTELPDTAHAAPSGARPRQTKAGWGRRKDDRDERDMAPAQLQVHGPRSVLEPFREFAGGFHAYHDALQNLMGQAGLLDDEIAQGRDRPRARKASAPAEQEWGRRKQKSASMTIQIRGPRWIIERFRNFCERERFRSYHDGIAELMGRAGELPD